MRALTDRGRFRAAHAFAATKWAEWGQGAKIWIYLWFCQRAKSCSVKGTHLGNILTCDVTDQGFRHFNKWNYQKLDKKFWRRQWQPTPLLLPGKSHGRRSLVGCRLWGRKGSDTTEWLQLLCSLSCIGEGNGSPLQCSRLEDPRGGGAWWAAVYGVAQSRTRLRQAT